MVRVLGENLCVRPFGATLANVKVISDGGIILIAPNTELGSKRNE
jgi:hypothetical protein